MFRLHPIVGEIYPETHDFSIEIEYILTKHGIKQRTRIHNHGGLNLPIILAHHTTFSIPFCVGGVAEHYRLRLPVSGEYLRDERLRTTGEYINDFDLKESLNSGRFMPTNERISRHFLRGSGAMRLTDTTKKMSVIYRVSQGYTHWMVYNGGGTDFICIEPQSCAIDAFNLDCESKNCRNSVVRRNTTKTFTTHIHINA